MGWQKHTANSAVFTRENITIYNIMCLQIKEGSTVVLLYNNISTPKIALLLVLFNINNCYDPIYKTKFSGACWNKGKLVFPVQITTGFTHREILLKIYVKVYTICYLFK